MTGPRSIRLGSRAQTFSGTERTRVYGLMGHPVSHTLSPRLQQAALTALGLDAVYLAFDVRVEELDEAWERLQAAAAAGILLGMNVTLPLKRAVLERVQSLDGTARLAGAVNVLWFERRQGSLDVHGANTDVEGLRSTLSERAVSIRGAPVIVVGAGGMARAAVVTALQGGAAEIRVLARAPERAAAMLQSVVSDWNGTLPILRWDALSADPRRILADAALLVQATSLGLRRGDPSPLPLTYAPPAMFVFESIYNPQETTLLREAREMGLAAANGLAMLLYQGAAALRLWTGCEPPLAAMRASLDLP